MSALFLQVYPASSQTLVASRMDRCPDHSPRAKPAFPPSRERRRLFGTTGHNGEYLHAGLGGDCPVIDGDTATSSWYQYLYTVYHGLGRPDEFQ